MLTGEKEASSPDTAPGNWAPSPPAAGGSSDRSALDIFTGGLDNLKDDPLGWISGKASAPTP